MSATDHALFQQKLEQTKEASSPQHVSAMSRIAEFRRKAGLPQFNPSAKESGTVAVAMVRGQEFFGVSSGFSPQSLTLRQQTLDRLQAEGHAPDLGTLLHEARELTHAEAHALMLAYTYGGDMRGTVTVYVDRDSCNLCSSPLNAVSALQRLYGIDELIIIDGNGRRFDFPRMDKKNAAR